MTATNPPEDVRRQREAWQQQATMDLGMEGLDPPIHDLGEAGDVRDIDRRNAGGKERRLGAAGRDDLDAAGGERPGEIDEAGLVGNGEEGAAERDAAARARESSWRFIEESSIRVGLRGLQPREHAGALVMNRGPLPMVKATFA